MKKNLCSSCMILAPPLPSLGQQDHWLTECNLLRNSMWGDSKHVARHQSSHTAGQVSGCGRAFLKDKSTEQSQQSSWKKTCIKNRVKEELQDGRGVRHGDHLPPHKYIRNTSTCGTTPTEHLLNSGRRPETSQKARNPPRTWVGQKKKKKKKNRDRTCNSGRELWRRKSFHTLGSPFTGSDRGWQSFGTTKESTATGVQRAKRRDFRTEDWCQTALTSLRGLSAHQPGWAGAGSWGSGSRGQIPGRELGLAAWTQPEGG